MGGDAEPVARLAHCPFEHDAHAEQRAHRADIERFPFEREDRRTRRHPQPGDFRERVDQLVGDAVAEVFVFGIGTRVDERQYGDRPRAGRCARTSRALGSEQRGDELRGAREALVRIFLQGPLQRPLDCARHLRPEPAHRPRRLGHVLRHHHARAATAEGRLTRQHFIDDARQAIHIARRTEVLVAARLLGAHVLGCPHREPHFAHRLIALFRVFLRVAARARHTEIREHGVTIREQNVLRFHITMDEAFAVSEIETGAHFLRNSQRDCERQRPRFGQTVAERSARHVRLHVIEQPASFP